MITAKLISNSYKKKYSLKVVKHKQELENSIGITGGGTEDGNEVITHGVKLLDLLD